MRTRALAAACTGVALAAIARAEPPPAKPSDPVPSPGRAIASDDDATATSVNPADLAFMPSAELRWTTVQTGEASTVAGRGHAVDLAIPFWVLATGLRLDIVDPPRAAPDPFVGNVAWLRWGLAVRSGETFALGTTVGWSYSGIAPLDDYVTLTTGATLRPFSWLSIAAVARDWNGATGRSFETIDRTYDAGVAVRPWMGRRRVELGLEASWNPRAETIAPRATAGIDVPRIGRLRGDLTVLDWRAPAQLVATAGLDVNLGALELSGGGVFGSAITRGGTGFYAGAAIRGWRDPGVRLPARVVKIRIDGTPGVRAHVHLLRRLWRMAEDPEVAGLVLVLKDEPASSLAHAEELGDAIRALRAHGKKVLCHLEDAGGRALYTCAQADRIAMNPAGGIRFAGLASSYYYLGGLAKKLGVRVDMVRIGAHKSAAEQFALDKPTDVAHADHADLLARFQAIYLNDVGGGRRIPAGELARRFAKGPFFGEEARAAGLVDTLAYDDQIDRVVEEMMGERVKIVDDEPVQRAPERWGNPSKIAVVYLAGDMVDGESRTFPFIGIKLAGSYTMARALKRAREDATVKAVVFRIETGGGLSLAADVMLREAILTARVKPLVVSMGSSAASGGYYAAVAGKPIFVNPATVTGSIGIFYGKADVSGLLEKLGVHMDQLRTSPRADAESLYRPYTDEEHVQLGIKVKQFYDTFVGRVAEGRHMTPAAVDAIGRGKVWTGAEAVQNGLVDRIGGIREALVEARRQAHLPADAPIVELPDEDDSLLGMLLGLAGVSAAGVPAGVATVAIPPAMMELARALSPFLVFDGSRPLARMDLVGEGTGFEGDVAAGVAGPFARSVPEED